MIFNIIFITIWLLSFVINFGITLAYFENEYPNIVSYKANIIFSFIISIFGPIGLIVSYFMSKFAKHGFQYRSHRITY